MMQKHDPKTGKPPGLLPARVRKETHDKTLARYEKELQYLHGDGRDPSNPR